MDTPRYAYFGGEIVAYQNAKIGVLTHTLNYGTGVFGGLRGYWNPENEQLFVFRPLDHFRRFLDSAKLLCMEFSHSEQDLANVLNQLLRAEEHKTDCYIRPLAYFADETIGVRLHDLKPAISIVSFPFGSYVQNEEGVRVTVSSWRRVDDNMIPARGKIVGSYANSAFAKTDAIRAGYDEALVLNQNGHLCEGSAENLFVIRQGVAATPPITDNILEGITRRTIMSLLREELQIEVVERPIDRTEIYLAEEAFFCGTGIQVAAISQVDRRHIGTGRMGPVTQRLRDLYFRIVRGQEPKYLHWCSPVYQSKEAVK